MGKYDKMTDDQFENYLERIVNESPASHLLTIPGVYEAVSEYFYNDVLDAWEADQPDDDEEEDDIPDSCPSCFHGLTPKEINEAREYCANCRP